MIAKNLMSLDNVILVSHFHDLKAMESNVVQIIVKLSLSKRKMELAHSVQHIKDLKVTEEHVVLTSVGMGKNSHVLVNVNTVVSTNMPLRMEKAVNGKYVTKMNTERFKLPAFLASLTLNSQLTQSHALQILVLRIRF
jgi:hypothetical protein